VTVILHYSSLERTVRYSVDYKRKTEGPQPSLCVKIWRSVVFVIAPVLFLYYCLSRETETRSRTASLALSALALCTFMYVINQEPCGNEI
jgi:hypothetical protein